MNSRLLVRIGLALACGLGVVTAQAQAQTQTQALGNKPIRIVSPFGAGGPNDVFARAVGQRLADRIGQPVIVENRAGADGRIGARAVAEAPPDGHTLLMLGLGHTAHPSLYDLPYDVEKGFAPISRVASVPLVLVVSNQLGVDSVSAFVKLMQARPGQLNYASAGNGTSQHLAMEMLLVTTGARMQHVPYKGIGPAITDLISGQIDALMSPVASVLPFIREGKLKALATTTATRFSLLPDVPTVAESGWADYRIDTWHGLVAPAGTPAAIVERLSREVQAILADDEVKAQFMKLGAMAAGNSPDAFRKDIHLEIERWRKVIKEAGITGS